MVLDETYENIWEEKENEWQPYVKNDALSTGFRYAKYWKEMGELTRFGMKKSRTLPSIAKKFFYQFKR